LEDDFTSPAIAERRWTLRGRTPERITQRHGELVVDSLPGASAFVEAKLPLAGGGWTAPGTIAPAAASETLEWRARVSLLGEYSVVLEWGEVLVQLTRYGVHVTAPDGGGGVRGTEWHDAAPGDGSAHVWRVVRSQEIAELTLDGRSVWRQALRSENETTTRSAPRLGETRDDASHAARLAIEWVRYYRQLSRYGTLR
jgi:hypothetical protein